MVEVYAMQTFTSLDLQQRTGDVQRAATQEPIVVTAYGKPRNVVMSVEEFRRLKTRVGEELPPEVSPLQATIVRAPDDPLGYDMSDYHVAVDKMIEDVRSGRTAPAIAAELECVRRLFRASA
jgi:prevent-host-death family protein